MVDPPRVVRLQRQSGFLSPEPRLPFVCVQGLWLSGYHAGRSVIPQERHARTSGRADGLLIDSASDTFEGMTLPIRMRVQEVRESLGLTQAQLADKAGVSRATVNRYENQGVGGIDFDTLEALGDALGVNPVSLLVFERAATRSGR